MIEGIFTSWIPRNAPCATICIPSKIWNRATTINNFEAKVTVSRTSELPLLSK